MRVLVVDDEPDIRFIIGTSLQRWGYETAEATNAEEAYAICRDDPPDIMLLDVSMPGETGIELLDRLRADDLIPARRRCCPRPFPVSSPAWPPTTASSTCPSPSGWRTSRTSSPTSRAASPADAALQGHPVTLLRARATSSRCTALVRSSSDT